MFFLCKLAIIRHSKDKILGQQRVFVCNIFQYNKSRPAKINGKAERCRDKGQVFKSPKLGKSKQL